VDVCGSDVSVQSRAAAAGSGCVNVCRVQLLLAVHVCVQSAASAGCGWLCMQSVAAAGCCCLWMDVCAECSCCWLWMCVCAEFRVQLLLAVHGCVQNSVVLCCTSKAVINLISLAAHPAIQLYIFERSPLSVQR
jgi:hypothetical protein